MNRYESSYKRESGEYDGSQMSPRNEEEEKAYLKQLKSLKKKMRHSPDDDQGTPGKQIHL